MLDARIIIGCAGAASTAVLLWAGFTLSYFHHPVWTMRNMKVVAIDQGQELAGIVIQALIVTYFRTLSV